MKRWEKQPWEERLTRLPLSEKGFSPELTRRIKEQVDMPHKPRRRIHWLRWTPVLASVLALAILWSPSLSGVGDWLSGALTRNELQGLETMNPDKAVTLKVASDEEASFMTRFGKAFLIRYPHAELQVVTPPKDGRDFRSFEQWLSQEKPDVLALDPSNYAKLASGGKLYGLDGVIRQDRVDLSDFHPGVLDLLRREGDGHLYGLAPDMEQLAVYYNKALFDQYGIAYPKDAMSWEGLLLLAAHFAGIEGPSGKIYGLSVQNGGSPLGLAQRAAVEAKGLTLTDPSGSRAALNTAGWRQVWSLAAQMARNGSIYEAKSNNNDPKTQQEFYRTDPFMTGKAAITLQGFSYAQSLSTAGKLYGLADFDWDVAAEPVHANETDTSATFRTGTIFAVYAQSENRRAAWEMIKFINSPEMARKQTAAASGSWATSRLDILLAPLKAGKHEAAFTKLKPAEAKEAGIEVHKPLPLPWVQQVWETAHALFQEVLAGTLTVDQAVQKWQQSADAALAAFRQDQASSGAGAWVGEPEQASREVPDTRNTQSGANRVKYT